MTIQAALKEDLSQSPAGYDQGLLDRLLAWQELTGNSNNVVARMINRSAAAVSQYKNQKYPGNVAEIEKEIAQMLRREEEMEFTAPGTQFCNTGPAKLIWEVLQFCDEQQDMGIAVGPAGIGKTQTCNEYFRRNRATVFITADIATRSVGSVLWMLAKRVGVTPKTRSNSNLLHAVIRQLKDSHRLVLIDEAHFLTWEAFEVIRKIHDCAGVGVAYVGMERLYDQMRGGDNRAMLFDQIHSRIAIKRDDLQVKKKDVRLVAESMCPGLSKGCVTYLFGKAKGKGRLRAVAKILKVAIKMHLEFERPIDEDTLEQAAGFLMA